VEQRAARLAQGVLICALIVAPLFGLQARAATPQDATDKPITNPPTRNPAAIKEGNSLFRANCSPCHGLSAHGGGRGPDLTSGRWAHGSSDSDIFHTIAEGVAGTQMPANSFQDSETWAIIAYLRSLAPAARTEVSGDRGKGEKLFSSAGCAVCHMVKGRGGVLGPDLSRVGASRSTAYLAESIREPDKDLSDGMLDPNNHYGLPLIYDTVTVVLPNGNELTGVAKNEDTFTIQLIDAGQQLHLFQKRDLKSVRHEHKSMMPAYSEQTIRPAELQDLLSYLEGLRGE